MVEKLSAQLPVELVCAALEVSRSGYYEWLNGPESARDQTNRMLLEEIRKVFKSNRGRYGSPRVTEQLRAEGQSCNHKRVERLMRLDGSKG